MFLNTILPLLLLSFAESANDRRYVDALREWYIKAQDYYAEGDWCYNFEKTKIKFLLFTKKVPKIHVLEIKNQTLLKQSTYDISKKTIVIIHGMHNNGVKFSTKYFRREYIKSRDVNLIFVDWGHYSQCPDERFPEHIMPHVGESTADFIRLLIDHGSSVDMIHVLGHSGGAHIAGFTGKYLYPIKIGRITGLDPASADFPVPISSSDATFVDILLTSTLSSKSNHQGHAIFYANDGNYQPACYNVTEDNEGCNHMIAINYYEESILYPKNFCAMKCDIKKWGYGKHLCEIQFMGENVSLNARGNYYFRTKAKYPFGFGCEEWKI